MIRNTDEFKKAAHRFVDWMAEYLENIEDYPVKSQVLPGEIFNSLPGMPPEKGELTDTLLADFERLIVPGITHWQSPSFFAYFPANSSFPSVLAEMLTATLGAQCMLWETSPAAAELEEKMMNWLRNMLGLPDNLHGVIQDSASSSTLAALLTAREKFSAGKINREGFRDYSGLRVYASTEAHSSVDKAVKIAGMGHENMVKIPTDHIFRMDPGKLEEAIDYDLKSGKLPLAVVATLGTTGPTSIDPLPDIAEICARHNLWLHVDAAMAGTALLLPEYRWMIEGMEQVDSFVFNPHKWMFTNFDCSAYFVKDRDALVKTFEITPEYLKTDTRGRVNDYRDWGIPLGRRFRALKLWFVIRSYGVKGLRETVESHIQLARDMETRILKDPSFELLAPVTLNTLCFRHVPEGVSDEETLDRLNEQLLKLVNATGECYMTHTRLNGKYTLRMVIGQTRVQKRHVMKAWDLIRETAPKLTG
ncbi:MAG TPA: aspartate aminotransferase family protein [Bacteroidetes bacterium]|nr:aspartate aminotransferase family protein [Bacteroidota bacterium]